MSAERYKIQRLDQGTELIARTPTSNVEPFPVKRWNEPLPIAVEGRPLPNAREEKPEIKSLTRFYPPLLFFSTTLTAVFLFLYLTKPVIVAEEGAVTSQMESSEVAEVVDVIPPSVEKVELSPWPESEALIANELPGLEPLRSEAPHSPQMIATTLGVEQIVEVESLNGELEKFTVSLPVLYPENVLSWNEGSIAEAHQLASDIEEHLQKVREVQANGVELLESWNLLVSKSVPNSVLPEGQAMNANP
ncbi:MAG: hypothetical protein ACSHYB_13405 [Roseibacillus sp.]